MKKNDRNSLKVGMSRGEIAGGFIFLPFYVIGIALILGFILAILGIDYDTALINLIYFYVCFFVVVIIFRKYLGASFRLFCKTFFSSFQAIILSFVLYYALLFGLSLILNQFVPGLTNPNDEVVYGLLDINPGSMIVCAVLLGPLVEEVIFRGLIFGLLQKKSRVAAYIIMYLAFAAIHLWETAVFAPDWTLLVNALQYLPASIVFGWCYVKGGNIWCPIFLHMIINGVSFASYL